MDLSLVWAAIIVVGVVMYVIMDGFDLGIGALFPWVRDEENRSLMMASVAPVWDGNETWLVLGGVAIFAAFPRAYSSLLPALYLPIFPVFLAGLDLPRRGVRIPAPRRDVPDTALERLVRRRARRLPPSPRGSSWAPSSRVSTLPARPMSAAPSTG